jgi:hypothetical protein
MKSLHSKSRLTKSLVRTGILVTSLALAGNAFAANPGHVAAKTAAHHVVHHAASARHRQVVWQQPVFPFFAGLFGLPIPFPVTTHAARGTSSSDAGGYDPTFDSPSPAVEVDNSQSQAAIDAADQAMQQEVQSLQDMNASNAAAEAQNDAANAATQQYMINNGM